MSIDNQQKLYRAAAVLTVLIALTFIIVGIVIQNWILVAVFAVIGMAGLVSHPALAHRPSRPTDR